MLSQLGQAVYQVQIGVRQIEVMRVFPTRPADKSHRRDFERTEDRGRMQGCRQDHGLSGLGLKRTHGVDVFDFESLAVSNRNHKTTTKDRPSPSWASAQILSTLWPSASAPGRLSRPKLPAKRPSALGFSVESKVGSGRISGLSFGF